MTITDLTPETLRGFARDLGTAATSGFRPGHPATDMSGTLERHQAYKAQYEDAVREVTALSPAHLEVVLGWLRASRTPERSGFQDYAAMAEAFCQLAVPSLTGLFGSERNALLEHFSRDGLAQGVAHAA